MEELNAVVTQVVQISPSMKVFKITPDWELDEFKSGQFVALSLPASAPRCAEATEEYEKLEGDRMIKRAYSIASSSKSTDSLEFYITLVKSGALTPRLFKLKVGDRVGVGKKIVGMFTMNQVEESRNLILIGTGTGVAPYMSMLRSDALKRKGKIAVIQGASNSWDLGYSSELQMLDDLSDKFTYIPTITEPEKEVSKWNKNTEFVQDMWTNKIIEEKCGFKPSPENTDIFLCGNPKMISAMKEVLGKDGFTVHSRKNPGQIHIEEF
jgi:ferredoxin--NADP+ reductase